MNLRTGILVGFYLVVSLMLCSFILLMNEDNEGMGAPSVMSPVRSSQKGSVLQQIIWSLIVFFFISCTILNRMRSESSTVNQLLKQARDQSIQKSPEMDLQLKENSKEELTHRENNPEHDNKPSTSRDITAEILGVA